MIRSRATQIGFTDHSRSTCTANASLSDDRRNRTRPRSYRRGQSERPGPNQPMSATASPLCLEGTQSACLPAPLCSRSLHGGAVAVARAFSCAMKCKHRASADSMRPGVCRPASKSPLQVSCAQSAHPVHRSIAPSRRQHVTRL